MTSESQNSPVKVYKADCGCVVRLWSSFPPVSNLTTATYCDDHALKTNTEERDKIHDAALLFFDESDRKMEKP